MPEFRNATIADAENIAMLHAKNWQLNYRGILEDHYLDHQVVDDRQKVWRARLTDLNPSMFLVLAEEANELIGFACLFLEESEQYGAYLDNLHVAENHSGKGIGKHLMRLLAEEIERLGGRQDMYLWVLKDNIGAIRLYDKISGERKEQLMETELWDKPVEKIRYYWPDVSVLMAI